MQTDQIDPPRDPASEHAEEEAQAKADRINAALLLAYECSVEVHAVVDHDADGEPYVAVRPDCWWHDGDLVRRLVLRLIRLGFTADELRDPMEKPRKWREQAFAESDRAAAESLGIDHLVDLEATR